MEKNDVIRAAFVLRDVARKDWLGFRTDVENVAALYAFARAEDAKDRAAELRQTVEAQARSALLNASLTGEVHDAAHAQRRPSR